MNIVLVAVVVVLGVVTGYLASQARRRASDIGDVNAEVRVDTEGLVAAVKEAVDARVGKAAQEALKSNTELANQLIDERSRTLEEQTKNLLQPVTEQMHQLKASVGDLKSTYEKNRGSVDSLDESHSTNQRTDFPHRCVGWSFKIFVCSWCVGRKPATEYH